MAGPGASPYVWGWLLLGGCLLAGAQLDFDGTITIEEQIVLVLKAKVQCELNITAQLQEGGVAFRHCNLNGTWDFMYSLNKTWANYSDCLRFLHPDISIGKQEFFERLYVMYTIGYSVSFGSLAVAILIIGYFRRLHCTRNYIHMHLFVSFMLRAVSIFVKDKVVHAHIGVKELQSLLMQDDLQNSIEMPSVDKSKYIITSMWRKNWRKVIIKMKLAFLNDTHIPLSEGSANINLIALPINPMRLRPEEVCWELSAGNIKWIYQAPILAAIGLNFILFLNTVRVLATKIWETNAVGHDTRKQYRKLAKSTLVLVLVFGVHYIVFLCLPHSFTGLGWQVRMHCELFFNSFQGFFVSIIYCYCNGEVQAEVKKLWSRWNLSIDWKRAPPCGGHRYGSVLTTFTHSTSSQSQGAASARLVLIAGKTTRTAGRQPDSHMTLPGYVWSNSEQDCLPRTIHEETKEGNARLGEEIAMVESPRPLEFNPGPQGSRGETEDVL
ncbi:hypothetical protein GH733_008472 [Mirounga leonina]|nr:hypothetical protein GH733_008472 [Mirounga leonina]